MESFSVNESSHRNWVELPRDLTMSILSRVEDIDILRSAQFVCSSWLKICRDPLLWRTIQLRGLSSPDFPSDLETICRRAVDYSSGQLVEINIGDFATDRLLQYITNRSSQIKCLRLFRCFQISDGGLSAAAAKLPLLEELELSNGSLTKESLEAVGRQCPHLKLLKFNFQGEGNRNFVNRPVTPNEEVVFNEHAIAIAKNLPGLRNLELVGNEMTDVGLQAVLDGCPHLESLDLRCCFNIRMQGNLQKRCKEQIKRLLLPHDGTIRLVEEAHQAWDEYYAGNHEENFGPEDDNDEYEEYSQFDDDDCFGGFEDDFADLSSGRLGIIGSLVLQGMMEILSCNYHKVPCRCFYLGCFLLKTKLKLCNYWSFWLMNACLVYNGNWEGWLCFNLTVCFSCLVGLHLAC
ncbi:hypothetical protein TIFTF001_023697 [Ficus carica]|uniref:F-box domain-containing protein n=1 Tax=Ficus carica TaxID=3494 RepID=A0AA88DK84_FICCA|nr:hypothetical protein TIFTF001_023697 [Ficus carica]